MICWISLGLPTLRRRREFWSSQFAVSYGFSGRNSVRRKRNVGVGTNVNMLSNVIEQRELLNRDVKRMLNNVVYSLTQKRNIQVILFSFAFAMVLLVLMVRLFQLLRIEMKKDENPNVRMDLQSEDDFKNELKQNDEFREQKVVEVEQQFKEELPSRYALSRTEWALDNEWEDLEDLANLPVELYRDKNGILDSDKVDRESKPFEKSRSNPIEMKQNGTRYSIAFEVTSKKVQNRMEDNKNEEKVESLKIDEEWMSFDSGLEKISAFGIVQKLMAMLHWMIHDVCFPLVQIVMVIWFDINASWNWYQRGPGRSGVDPLSVLSPVASEIQTKYSSEDSSSTVEQAPETLFNENTLSDLSKKVSFLLKSFLGS